TSVTPPASSLMKLPPTFRVSSLPASMTIFWPPERWISVPASMNCPAPVDQAGDPAQAEALGMTDLNGGAFFNAEFGIGHRGNTVPERSGVALSFCGRRG